MSRKTPNLEHDYQNLFMDSTRWQEFIPRAGDIIVCTPYKSGTTWTQMICALLIFQRPELPRPLAELSPWLDLRIDSLEDVINNYEAQTHRRFIKTHTPLDGIPYFEDVTYLYCGRDPRDIFISMQNHGKNQRIPDVMKLLAAQGVEVSAPPELPESLNERFRLWLSKPAFAWEKDGFPYWSVFSHSETFWQYRDLANIHFLHYADLKSDLSGQMRRVANILGIEIDEALWPTLVEAATFSAMKSNADQTVPESGHAIWESNAAFFHKGENEQWRTELDDESLAMYEQVKSARDDLELAEWLEKGFLASGVSEHN